MYQIKNDTTKERTNIEDKIKSISNSNETAVVESSKHFNNNGIEKVYFHVLSDN